MVSSWDNKNPRQAQYQGCQMAPMDVMHANLSIRCILLLYESTLNDPIS